MTLGRLALLVFLALNYGAPVQALDIVSRFVGVWVGNGLVRPNGFDASVAVRCRIQGDRISATQVRFAGRCATTNGSGTFAMMIAQDSIGRVFAAKGQFAQTGGWVDFSGTGDENSIVLIQKKPLLRGDEHWLSEIALGLLSDGRISFDNNLSDISSGRKALSFSVVFRARD